MGLYLSREPFAAPTNFDEARVLCENGLYRIFFHEMLQRGVALAPGAYEIMFVSHAHTRAHLDEVVAIAAEAARVTVAS